MIGRSGRLTAIRSIEVGFRSCWFILFFLIIDSLATRFVSEDLHWTAVGQYAVGIVMTLPFLVSVLLDELAHRLVVWP